MKKYLKLFVAFLFCIALAGCGSSGNTAEPDSVISKGEKLVTKDNNVYTAEIEFEGVPERVELDGTFTAMTGEKDEYYKIKAKITNTGDTEFALSVGLDLGLANSSKEAIFYYSPYLRTTQDDEIATTIAPGATEEGYVYFEAKIKDYDTDETYSYDEAKYIYVNVLTDGTESNGTATLTYDTYYIELN